MKLPSWLPQIVVESTLIVLSILLALAVDQWQDRREEEKLADQALISFQREIQQNKARLEDVTPFRMGMRDVLIMMDSTDEIRTSADFRTMVGVEGFRAPFLLDTAWQTALATGALTHMDYETVSALSHTYTLQERLQDFARSSLPQLVRTGTAPDNDMDAALQNTIAYLNDVAARDEELQAVYAQALEVIESTRARMKRDALVRDVLQPTP